jgi:hypothetical protein
MSGALAAPVSGMESEGFGAPTSPAPVTSDRSRNRAAWWRQDLERTAVYLMGQARTEGERAFVEKLYEQVVKEGPDFINYRSKSAFEAAPRLSIDRNAPLRVSRGQSIMSVRKPKRRGVT